MLNVNSKDLNDKYKLVLDTIKSYPLQFKEAWSVVSNMRLPDEYRDVRNIVLCGMGGSALGGRVVKSFLSREINIPFEIVDNYFLPGYVNSSSLVVCYSYSGNTEETLEAAFLAMQSKAKLFGVTSGGKLAELFREHRLPLYEIDPTLNPSGQPRMSIGYAVGSVLGLLKNVSACFVSEDDVQDAIKYMYELLTELQESVPEERNIAKKLSSKLRNKAVFIVASEHLVGAAYTVKNQMNENSKVFASLFEIPELNHHLMEGLRSPSKLKDFSSFFFVNSDLYIPAIRTRYEITKDVVVKNGFDYIEYKLISHTRLSQVFELIILGSYITYFLTKISGVDPIAIPWVDFFKDQLNRSKRL
jgi:glucose/mannose-6-phosphate isomerase